MKKNLLCFTLGILLTSIGAKAQTLTLVSGKRVYDHHSSSLSGYAPYGNYNNNTKSGYDFVNHVNVASGTAALAANRDMVEHNGPFGSESTSTAYTFGFTDSVSNVGGFGYPGNKLTKFYKSSTVSFASLNTVSNLVAAYDSTAATSLDKQPAIGDVYIIRVRHTKMYVAMKITELSNLTAEQYTDLDNMQQVIADVYFGFDYKYGTLPAVYVGINEAGPAEENTAVTIYPNPANNQLSVSSNSSFKNYTILNTLGACVHSGLAESLCDAPIDVHTLEAGVYFIELLNDGGVMQRTRFIKN